MKVLIVDDCAEALLIAKARLAQESLEVVCASSGREGLDTAAATMPDLILLDVDMPDMSGFTVCEMLQQSPALCMVPVIFLSASQDAHDKVRGLDLGAVDYVTKPFDAFELRARVRAALRTKRLQDLLLTCTQIDPLTELGNRRALDAGLQQEWARAERTGSPLAVVMADIDYFKRINDQFGHHAGDDVLSRVAAVLRNQCRQCDRLFRYGGEEFVILLPAETAASASNVADRCRRTVAQWPVKTIRGIIEVTLSFGTADSRQASCTQELLDLADAAMYDAKHQGRNCVRVAHQPTLRTAI
ncbi:MAG: diguanylate cyclase [Planctomycetaceae bacterium]|nr:diguanylate cyclase [Planctomycetaceae bacterium]